MTIGFSIQSPALKQSTTNKEKMKYLGDSKELEDLLLFLKNNGVTTIEIRILEQTDDPKDFRKSIQLIWNLGMEITIHGDINGGLAGNELIDIYPSLEFILQNFEKYQDNLIIPLHAFQSPTEDELVLKENTIKLLKSWSSVIEASNLPIYIALENNRKKEAIDPGNSTEGVVSLVEEIDSKHVGICWDMGHYYSNLIQEAKLKNVKDYEKHLMKLPSVDFLSRVYHTHIHGLNNQNITHFPLSEQESLPLESYIESLNSVGYNKIYNLELSLPRWEENISYNEELFKTIDRLKKAVLNNK